MSFSQVFRNSQYLVDPLHHTRPGSRDALSWCIELMSHSSTNAWVSRWTVVYLWITSPNAAIQNIPNVFYWAEIWREGANPIFGYCSEPGTLGTHGRHAAWRILLKDKSVLRHQRNSYSSQNHIPASDRIQVAVDKHQLSLVSKANTHPNPNTGPPQRSRSRTFTSAKRSPRRRQTRRRPSPTLSLNRDSSENRILSHLRAFQPRYALDHCSRTRLRASVGNRPRYDDGSDAPVPEGDWAQSDRWSCRYGSQEPVLQSL